MQFLSDASFWVPDRFLSTDWMEHAPFIQWLFEALRPGVVVGDGNAVAVPGFVARKLELATRFVGSPELLDDGSVDLLHIDLTDSAVNERALSGKLSSRGVILVHGTNQHRGWRTWAADYPHFLFTHGLGLAVVGTGAALPFEVLDLLETNVKQSVRVRAVYERLGRGLKASLLMERSGEAVQPEAHETIHKLKQQLVALEAEETRKREIILNDLSSQVREIRAEIEQPHIAEVKRLEGVCAAAALDLAFYKAEYLKAVNSRSWKLTSPLRGEGTLFDLFKGSTASK